MRIFQEDGAPVKCRLMTTRSFNFGFRLEQGFSIVYIKIRLDKERNKFTEQGTMINVQSSLKSHPIYVILYQEIN